MLAIASVSVYSASAELVFEKVLLPVVLPNPVAGAFGSLWSTHVTFLNTGNEPLGMTGLFPCPVEPCTEGALPPNSTVDMVPRANSSPTVGKFLGIGASRQQDLQIELRVFDASRSATSFGTHVPVIFETDAETRPVNLLGVATTAPFRALLRIYDFDRDASHAVTVNFYQPSDNLNAADQLVNSTTARLVPGPDNNEPGYAEVDISANALGQSPVRIEIRPVATGLRFWAMASVTNNNTQQVTLVTP